MCVCVGDYELSGGMCLHFRAVGMLEERWKMSICVRFRSVLIEVRTVCLIFFVLLIIIMGNTAGNA